MATNDTNTPPKVEEKTYEEQIVTVGPDGEVQIAPAAMEEDGDAPKEAFVDTPVGEVVTKISEAVSSVVKEIIHEIAPGLASESRGTSKADPSATMDGSSDSHPEMGNYEMPGVTGVSDFDPIGPGLAEVIKKEDANERGEGD